MDYDFPIKAEWLWKENDCYKVVLDFITSGKYQEVVEHIDDSKGAAFVVGMTYALGLMSKECSKYFVKSEDSEDSEDLKKQFNQFDCDRNYSCESCFRRCMFRKKDAIKENGEIVKGDDNA